MPTLQLLELSRLPLTRIPPHVQQVFNRLTTVGNHVHQTRRSNEFTAGAILARVQAGEHLDIDGGGSRTHDCFLVAMSTGGKMRFKTRIGNVDVIAQKALCMAYHDCPVRH